MDVTRVQLANGRAADVRRLGRPTGRPVLYFHSPASSGEELDETAGHAAHELDIELLTIVRGSLADHDVHGSFMATVASDAVLLVEALGLESVVVLGWSGGGPYALAACDRLGLAARSAHLVVALAGATHRSRRRSSSVRPAPADRSDVADIELGDSSRCPPRLHGSRGTMAIRCALGDAARDDLGSDRRREIVPPRLVDHLARQLPHAVTVRVDGSHDWITENWSTVLQRIANS